MKRYILYVKNSCGYCHKAVELLDNLNLDYDLISIAGSEVLFDSLKKAYKWNTVPMVFLEKKENIFKFIGGYDSLKETLGQENVERS